MSTCSRQFPLSLDLQLAPWPWASCFLLQRPSPTLLTIRGEKGLLRGAKVAWKGFILPLASSEKFNFQKGELQNHSLSFPDKAVDTAVRFVPLTANELVERISLGARPPWPYWFLGRRALLTWQRGSLPWGAASLGSLMPHDCSEIESEGGAKRTTEVHGKVEGRHPAQGAIVDGREMGGMSAADRTDGQVNKSLSLKHDWTVKCLRQASS